ncbi:MAG: site-specific integrase [Dethiobacteria bacterium]|nr:site-specific integrase [Bacillota bacterium]
MARGSMRQRGKNSWELTIELPRIGGKRRRKIITVRAKDKREAERELNRLQAIYQEKTFSEPSNEKLGNYLLSWLETVETFEDVARSTLKRYREIIVKHLIPALGEIPLSKLRPKHLTDYYTEALKNGRIRDNGPLSKTTVHHHHSVLRKALNDAKAQKLIHENPAADAKAPSMASRDVEVLMPDQLNKLMDRLKSSYVYLPSYISMVTGARLSEVLGLKWEDIDFKNKTISIERSLLWDDEGWYFNKNLKSNYARRQIDIEDEDIEVLKHYRELQLQQKLEKGPEYNDLGLVCCKDDGTPLRGDNVTKRFKIIARSIGLGNFNFHGLRHTHATLLLMSGVPINIVSERLGHYSAEFTLKVYIHKVKSMQKVASKTFRAILDACRDSQEECGLSLKMADTEEHVRDGSEKDSSKAEARNEKRVGRQLVGKSKVSYLKLVK